MNGEPALPQDARAPTASVLGVMKMALPFTLVCGVQAALNATDTWFVGRISTVAVAALSVAGWITLFCILLGGGASLATQLLAAQAHGARRGARASLALWNGVWCALLAWPAFAILACNGDVLFAGLGFDGEMRQAMDAYWMPRLLGAPAALALMGFTGFFCGIGRATTALWITSLVAVANVVANQVLVVGCGIGIAGSAWSTNLAQMIGVAAACASALTPDLRRRYGCHRTVRPRVRRLLQQFRLGVPIGLQYASEFFAFAVFQFIEARLGEVDAAATQIVLSLTSFCYLPASGMALAATTLVGHHIGSGEREAAYRAGNRIVLMTVGYMFAVGALIAIAGESIVTPFTNPADPQSASVIALASKILWIAAAYQIFDGLGIASGACLRGAADVRVPALIILASACLLFVPLAHSLAFAPSAGWLRGLPQFGYGTFGAWTAALIYIAVLGLALYWRWIAQSRRTPAAVLAADAG